jgi:hypothetical protein
MSTPSLPTPTRIRNAHFTSNADAGLSSLYALSHPLALYVSHIFPVIFVLQAPLTPSFSKYIINVKHGSSQAWFQQVQSFLVENIHLLGAARLVQSFPMGLIPDLISTNIFMAWLMTGNRHICALPHLGDNLVTMSPGLLSATQVASVWLSGVAVPAASIHPASRKLSCPAALGFWQLVGSLLACVNVFVADIFRRRAFLRTPEARARLGRELEAADVSWPFGNRALIEKGVAIGFCLSCLWASVVWNTALTFWDS